MRIPALLLIGGMTIATAQAQSGEVRWGLHPMPDTLPLMFFSPDSLAGTMLEPLAEPEMTADARTANREPMPSEEEEDPVVSGEAAQEQQRAPTEVAQADTADPAEAETADSADSAEPAAAATGDAEPDASAAPQPEPEKATAATVHVIVENVESGEGVVNVAVCDTSLSQEGCPYYTQVPASPGFVEAMLDDIPPGTYAVVGYHDVNGNDEFDRLLGVPREPYALSGAAGDTLVPDFSDAALEINQGVNYVIIRMRRLGSG